MPGIIGRTLRATLGQTFHPSAGGDVGSLFGPESATERGRDIAANPESAIRGTVYACIRLISETVGSLPVHLYERDGRFRKIVEDHPYAPILSDAPNEEMDAAEFWRQLVGWMLARGAGVAYPLFDKRGQFIELWPIPANRVKRARRPGDHKLVYIVDIDPSSRVGDVPTGREVILFPEEVLDFRAFGLGVVPLSPIANHAETIALAENAEEYGARFFDQGGVPGGSIVVPGELKDDAWQRMRTRWEEMHRGVKRSHLVAVLEGGAKWEQSGLSHEDMQFLETRRFQVADIARIFGVPPHMVGDVERSTSWGTGIEQQTLGFIQFTLLPWLTRLERVTKFRLFAGTGIYTRWNTAGLLRGDLHARYQAYAIGRQWGWLSANDVAALEDKDPIPNGDTYLVPLNMAMIGPDGTIDQEDLAARATLLRVLQDLGLPADPPKLPLPGPTND